MTAERKTKIRAAIEKLLKVELKIANAAGEKIVPFKLNDSQAELDSSAEEGGKHAVLKARQLGISTYIVARFLLKCLTEEGTHAAIISHERDATIKLLRKAKFFIKELREDGITVNVGYDSKKEMTFPDTNSSFYIGTAGQHAFSRGDTLTHVHASEVAFWENAESLMRGVLGACTPNAEIFLESTANGAGGYFYDICQKAMAAHPHWSKYLQKQTVTAANAGGWTFHFYPWTDEPLYSSDVPKNAPLWTEEERDLKEKFGLTFRQLMWRRNKIGDFKSLDDFLAEYPLTPDEAFIVTGSCYFDKPTLRLYEKLCADPIATGSIEMVGQRPQLNRFAEDADLSIWDYPRPGFSYLIPADASEGIEGEETDEAVAPVICRDLYKQAATLAGKVPPLDYAERLYALGAYYNWALIAVEDNGPGLGTLHKLLDMGYPHLYYHKKLDIESGEMKQKLGWHTSEQTRPLMLGQLRSDFKKHQIFIRDRRLLKQCTTFCRQKNGRYEANSGCHDDHVTSMAVGAYIHAHEPMPIAGRDEVDSRYPGGGGGNAPQSTSRSGY